LTSYYASYCATTVLTVEEADVASCQRRARAEGEGGGLYATEEAEIAGAQY
jgi:hypothetical protein